MYVLNYLYNKATSDACTKLTVQWIYIRCTVFRKMYVAIGVLEIKTY